jgi:DNA-binding XRE family transcriptional regulator
MPLIEALSPAVFVLVGLSAVAVSRQTVNAIEKGKSDPSLPLAFRAARLFGMPIEEIFLDEAVQFDEGRQP